MKYTEVLVNLPSFKEGRYEDALRESFHRIDELLEDETYAQILKQLRARPNPSDLPAGQSSRALNEQTLQANTGSIIRPLTAPNRSASPESDDGMDGPLSPTPEDFKKKSSDSLNMIRQLLEGAKHYSRTKKNSTDGPFTPPPLDAEGSPLVRSGTTQLNTGTTPSAFADDDDSSVDSSSSGESNEESNSERDSDESLESDLLALQPPSAERPYDDDGIVPAPVSKPVFIVEDGEVFVDELIRTAVHIPPVPPSQAEEKGESSPVKTSPPKSPTRASSNPYKGETYTSVFSERIEEETAPVRASEHAVSVEVVAQQESKPEQSMALTLPVNNGGSVDDSALDSNKSSEAVVEPAAPVSPKPTFITKGNANICQLRDHRYVISLNSLLYALLVFMQILFSVLAGCTAIVALLIGNKLVVANAGDSRGVLCRNGQAVALSEDHKPSQDREMTRIREAGGFVNMVGRVNGNLNLSRSLGDLKYKQSKHLPPEAQMITAEPDILVIDINADDEFFVLACDGIWDVLSNQEACDFVREKVHEEHLTLEEVVHEAMMRCIADDPRLSQGIGGDNMTFLIVWLKEETAPKPWEEEATEASGADESSAPSAFLSSNASDPTNVEDFISL